VDVYKGLVEKRSVGLLFTDGSRVARS